MSMRNHLIALDAGNEPGAEDASSGELLAAEDP